MTSAGPRPPPADRSRNVMDIVPYPSPLFKRSFSPFRTGQRKKMPL